MKEYYINSSTVASDMQQSFKVEKPFVNDHISVFVNGNLKSFGEEADYITTPDTGRIVFNTPLVEGDVVSVVSVAQDERLSLDVVSNGARDKSTSLFKKYSSVPKFKLNNKYEVNICIGTDMVKWQFMTQRSPYFAKTKDIFKDIGEFIEGYTDEQVSEFIYSNSVDVIDLIDELASMETPVENVHYTVTDGIYETSNKAVKNWVKYKTEIDLIYARYFGISANYGSIRKEIGDISVEKSTKLPYIDNLLKRLVDWWEEADEEIRGTNTVVSFVKAGDLYKYEDWERTTLFNK